MNIGEKYNKTNIHYRICIEKADYFSPLLCFYAFRLSITNCELTNGRVDVCPFYIPSCLLKKPRVLRFGARISVLAF